MSSRPWTEKPARGFHTTRWSLLPRKVLVPNHADRQLQARKCDKARRSGRGRFFWGEGRPRFITLASHSALLRYFFGLFGLRTRLRGVKSSFCTLWAKPFSAICEADMRGSSSRPRRASSSQAGYSDRPTSNLLHPREAGPHVMVKLSNQNSRSATISACHATFVLQHFRYGS